MNTGPSIVLLPLGAHACDNLSFGVPNTTSGVSSASAGSLNTGHQGLLYHAGFKECCSLTSHQHIATFTDILVPQIFLSTTSRVHLCLQGLRKIFRVVLIGILHQVKVSLYQYPIVGLKNQSDWINLTMVVLTTGGSIYNGMI